MEQGAKSTTATLTPEQEDRLYDALNMLVRYLLKNLPSTDQEVSEGVNTQGEVEAAQMSDTGIHIS